MKLVIDTNVFIESISPKNRFNTLFKSLIEGQFHLYISNEILLEYEEVISQKCKPITQDLFFTFLETSPYVHKISPGFRYDLITSDPDDNKFVDCAIASNADYLVTRDNHFKILRRVKFPKVRIISPQEFIRKFLTLIIQAKITNVLFRQGY